jgi:hypothetical protein
MRAGIEAAPCITGLVAPVRYPMTDKMVVIMLKLQFRRYPVLTRRQPGPCSPGPAGVQRPSSTAPPECSHTRPSGCVSPAAAAGVLAETYALCGEC